MKTKSGKRKSFQLSAFILPFFFVGCTINNFHGAESSPRIAQAKEISGRVDQIEEAVKYLLRRWIEKHAEEPGVRKEGL